MWVPGFHLVNLSLHALVTALFFLFCLRLLKAYRTATLAAFLFAIHPIHTEAVSLSIDLGLLPHGLEAIRLLMDIF